MRQLEKAGVSSTAPPPASDEHKPPTQHKVALAALERKAERLNSVKVSSSQHAMALRGLEEKAHSVRSFKPTIAEAAPSAVNAQGEKVSVARAKQALAQKEQSEQNGSKQGSQMEEALRKLHGKGVVPTKQAFGIGAQNHEGTQKSEAMKAFMNKDGTDMSTGALKKTAVMSPPSKVRVERSGPSQRELAMQALAPGMRDE